MRLRWYADMEPRAENRILLSAQTDAHGRRVPAVSYELGERDRETLRALHGRLRDELRRLRVGILEGNVSDVILAATEDASHHVGGTRMGRHARTSVVDADCRVHSVENLYVAGSSVFPTCGSANPTYTIVALAIRLAEHLSEVLKGAA